MIRKTAFDESLRNCLVKTLLILLAVICLPVASAADEWPVTYDGLLKKYVTPAGVRYGSWKANHGDVAALREVVDAVASADVTKLSRDEQLAFYINAYNAWMLHEVIAAYPIKSVTEIAPLWGVFEQPRITVAGEKMSLNKLEKEIIIKQFREPRIHFTINCASKSCPPLQSEIFSAEKLDAQHDAATRTFVSENPLGVRVEGDTAFISELFKWYEADFADAGGAASFIRAHRTPPLPADIQIQFQPYDWGLNDAP